VRVSAAITRDPRLGNIDMLTSAVLEFPSGQCIFTCSTQIELQQKMCFYGTHGRIEPEIPFNATPGGVSHLIFDDGRDLDGGGRMVEEIAACDQYTLQGEAFSRAIIEGGQPPVPLEDSLRNMAVLDAVFRSAESGRAEAPNIAL
jgi:predicted dehydrogenase